MSEPTQLLVVDHAMWALFFDELGRESERGAAILAAAWIDHLLESKLAQLSSGNKEARTHFSTFSANITAAFRVGLLDDDVHHDLRVIQKIRNVFAHRIQGLSMESPPIKPLIESFQVPHREFYDWGKLRCAATAEGVGVVFHTDQSAEGLGEPLVIPAAFTFRLAVSWIIAYLAANLGVGILVPDEGPFDDLENSVESSNEE
jgi:hypothetical protein